MKVPPLFALIFGILTAISAIGSAQDSAAGRIGTELDLMTQKAEMAVLRADTDAGLQEIRTNLENHQNHVDGLGIIAAAILVLLMQAGFCLMKMGQVRAKNSLNVGMKNTLDFSAVSLSYLFIGFTLMYGIGMDDLKAMDFGKFQIWKISSTDPVWGFLFFQIMLAATCCTIASGSMAGRTRFIGYLIYTLILGTLIFPIFGHWVWGSHAAGLGIGGEKGWLEALGFHDFAGGTVIHVIGGATALAGIMIIGARTGRFGKDGSPYLIPSHNLALVVPGALLLWAGWFGIITGAGIHAEVELGRLCINTAVAGAAGCVFSMVLFWIIRGIPNVMVALNGVLGGLVAVSACCDVVNPLSALIIGTLAGVIATSGALLLEKVKLDDVTGGVSVHLFNGFWGTLAVALFNENGFAMAQLKIQALGTFSIGLGAFVIALTLFKLIDLMPGLRADEKDQKNGMDFAEHSANAYPDFQTTSKKNYDSIVKNPPKTPN